MKAVFARVMRRVASGIWAAAALAAHANQLPNGDFDRGAFAGGASDTFGLAPFSGSPYLELTATPDTGESGGAMPTITTVAENSDRLIDLSGSTNLYGSDTAVLATAGSTGTALSLVGTGMNDFQYLGSDKSKVDSVDGDLPKPGSQTLVVLALVGAGVLTARRQRVD